MHDKKRGLYLLSEIQCLAPGSGAYHHVQNGIKELKNYFNIDLFVLNRQSALIEAKVGNSIQAGVKNVKRNSLRNTLKWCYFLIIRNYDVFYWYFKVKKQSPKFIYERAAFLNYKGLIIARILGIPHFYEVNWAFYLEHGSTYSNAINTLSRKLETWAYNKSTYSFFIGKISECFKLRRTNYTNVQNGIDRSFADMFSKVSPKYKYDDLINIVFIGHAMRHHRLELLMETFGFIHNPERFHLHFIGGNYERFGLKFSPEVKVSFHGSLDHDAIGQILLKCEIGILPYAVPFSSAVKLFMYGASRLLLLMPDVKNLRDIFSNENAVFFQNENAFDLADALNKISGNLEGYAPLRQNAYKLVTEKYLWDKIFAHQAEIIKAIINDNSNEQTNS